MTFRVRVMFLLFAVAAASPSTISQSLGVKKNFDHPPTGVRFKYPSTFRATPTQPTEKLIIARFARPKPFRVAPKQGRRSPESFDVFVLAAGTTSAGETQDPVASLEEMVDRRNSISNVKEFLAQRYRVKDMRRYQVNRRRTGDYEEYWFQPRRGEQKGYVFVKMERSRTVGVVGRCDKVVFGNVVSALRKVGKSIHRPDGSETVKDPGTFYRGKKYRDIPFRQTARRQMVKGWKAHDTENFFIVYHTKNRRLLYKVAKDLEAIRPLYMKYFEPEKPIEAVSVVRICRDSDEYSRYGGPPGSGGYWNPVAKELVFYDYAKRPPSAAKSKKWRARESDSYVVLYHEAFHQYIYYAAGELNPHYWFNEGLGDFFSGTVIYKNSKKVKGVGLNRWRLPLAKLAHKKGKLIPLKELLNADRKQYYGPKVGLMYAQGWALCYFLTQADESEKVPEWRGIIPRYYEQLVESSANINETYDEKTPLTDRQKGQVRARASALKAALKGVDLPTLEKAWHSWIKKTKNPWAR